MTTITTAEVTTNVLQGATMPLSTGRSPVVMASDANRTLLAAEYVNGTWEITSSVSLTATRNVVAPLTDGTPIIVNNLTTGAQSITIIGATGTGVTIGSGKTAIVRCNGVNWIRVTADA